MAVVVQSAAEGFSVVRVQKVHDFCDLDLEAGIHYKWIVSVIDQEAIDAIEAFEAMATEKLFIQQRKEAQASLREKMGISDITKGFSFGAIPKPMCVDMLLSENTAEEAYRLAEEDFAAIEETLAAEDALLEGTDDLPDPVDEDQAFEGIDKSTY